MYLICIIRYFMDILLCLFLMVSLGQEACELNHDSHGDGTVWAADLVVFLGEYGGVHPKVELESYHRAQQLQPLLCRIFRALCVGS